MKVMFTINKEKVFEEAANMIYNDHAQSVAERMGMSTPEAVPNEKMALSMYRKAVEQLKDVDRPKFVREYFDL